MPARSAALQDPNGTTTVTSVADPTALRVAAALALLSGAPALVYQIVWSREVALVIGSQVEAISTVIAAFFGGLAVGAAILGRVADRARRPLRLYGLLEIVAGVLAIASTSGLRLIGEELAGRIPAPALLGLAAGVVFVITAVLGGTLPALLRSATGDPAASSRASGWLVGLNTVGAVAGVAASAVLVPVLGLQMTISIAGGLAILIGIGAVLLPGGVAPAPAPAATRSVDAARLPMVLALLVAAVGGVGTLAFEVLAARNAALILGSSLLAWALVLGLFLAGLAAGNMLSARRSARSAEPCLDLGTIEIAAAVVVALGAGWLVRSPAAPASGPSGPAVISLALWIVPATMLMGAAFPFYVRLTVRRAAEIGGAFGAVSAANTAGGIAGSMAGAFLLLPALGLRGGLLATAALNGLLGLGLLAAGAEGGRERLFRPAVGALVLAGGWFTMTALERLGPPPAEGPRVLHVAHGSQATAAVARTAGRRDLIVDGDPEASTGSNARVTEELLGTIPPLLHPDPRRFLEIGLGSGITLGTSSEYLYDRLECVEIADAVISCAPYFEPDNRGVASGRDERVVITEGDGRAYLLRHPATYDVIVANTLHPWSVGATGLYSREYFDRIRRALRPGGIAAQWLPLARLGADHLGAILRTFYGAFPEGELWWGADNLIVVGRAPGGAPADERTARRRYADAAERLRRFGIESYADLSQRRLADAATVLSAIGPGDVLTDDRPLLETAGAFRRARRTDGSELQLVASIVEAAAVQRPELRGMHAWLESRVARLRGDEREGDRLEDVAAESGLGLVAHARSRREVLKASAALAQRKLQEARRHFNLALREVDAQPFALFGLAMIEAQLGNQGDARIQVARLLDAFPNHAEGWNLLATIRGQAGDLPGAREALVEALRADPYFPEALANAGLLAVGAGDERTAVQMLDRLQALDREGAWPETRTLKARIEQR